MSDENIRQSVINIANKINENADLQGLEATEPYAKQLLGHSVVEAFTDK